MLFTTLQNHSKQLLPNFNATPFKGDGKKYHFVYVIQNSVNDMLYIGKRSSRSLDDGYLGSGNTIRSAKAELGEDVFQRMELSFFQNAQEALDAETILLKSKIVQDGAESFYNLQGFNQHFAKTFKTSRNAKDILANENELPSAFQERTSIEICFSDSLKLVCSSFLDKNGVRWYSATDAWIQLGMRNESKATKQFIRQDAAKVCILTLTNNKHKISELVSSMMRQVPLAPEILAQCTYTPNVTRLGTYFCHPLFMKYCCSLSTEAEVAILSGVQLQIKELTAPQLSLGI